MDQFGQQIRFQHAKIFQDHFVQFEIVKWDQICRPVLSISLKN